MKLYFKSEVWIIQAFQNEYKWEKYSNKFDARKVTGINMVSGWEWLFVESNFRLFSRKKEGVLAR